MNDIFRKWNMAYNARNSFGVETRNIKTFHYEVERIMYLGLKLLDLVLQKIKNSENIDFFKWNNKFGKQRIVYAVCGNYTYHKSWSFDIFICCNYF